MRAAVLLQIRRKTVSEKVKLREDSERDSESYELYGELLSERIDKVDAFLWRSGYYKPIRTGITIGDFCVFCIKN